MWKNKSSVRGPECWSITKRKGDKENIEWTKEGSERVCSVNRIHKKLRAYSVTELSLIKSWFDEGQFGLQGTTQRD